MREFLNINTGHQNKEEEVPERESEIVEWIKELELRRENLDKKMTEFDRKIVTLEWKTSQLDEFKRRLEEGSLKINHIDVIRERAEEEKKKLSQEKTGKKKEREEVAQDREFCNALISYLRSKLEIVW